MDKDAEQRVMKEWEIFLVENPDMNDEISSSPSFAEYLDRKDELRAFKEKFILPKVPHECISEKSTIYLCGNSLGLQPVSLQSEVNFQLTKWADQGVEGHFSQPTPWINIEDTVTPKMAKLVGAKDNEVVIMNSLTVNLHLMLVSFYRPSEKRHKILIEGKAFPSDYHAIVSQIQLRNFDPNISLLEIYPREGESFLREEDIEEVIAREGDTIALVLFSGIQYYTGQLFDMKRITNAGHQQGCLVGFDLAHAVGNVPLSLHEWGCDFACWCTYKYMNAGPGSIAGCFIHERHGEVKFANDEDDRRFRDLQIPRLSGWWGHRQSDRFLMEPQFIPDAGALGFRISNAPILLMATIKATLDIFDEAGMDKLRKKSELLTCYLEYLIFSTHLKSHIDILTPLEVSRRGCQLSLSFKGISLDAILLKLKMNGIICDARKPNVIRIAPTPLYNSFKDVFDFVAVLHDIFIPK